MAFTINLSFLNTGPFDDEVPLKPVALWEHSGSKISLSLTSRAASLEDRLLIFMSAHYHKTLCHETFRKNHYVKLNTENAVLTLPQLLRLFRLVDFQRITS